MGLGSTYHGTLAPHHGSVAHFPTEFIYSYDFDENGALFFLGTMGKRKPWINPHTLGQVAVFASSIGSGKLEDFVGRTTVNCRTLNEPFSHMGVDLGEGRVLRPTCYSLKNRNATSHVLMNWHLEASEDKINWVILDRRIYKADNPTYNNELLHEQAQLKMKGATSTWGVDPDVYKEVGEGGFRYFRLV